MHDLVATSAESIAESGVQSADDVRRQTAPLIRYSDELAEANRALRKFLYQNVYYHPRVAEVNQRACEMLRRVFEAYLADPDRLGEGAMRRVEKEGLHRTVCDYIAGMTDRYVMEEYARIAGRRSRRTALANVTRNARLDVRRAYTYAAALPISSRKYLMRKRRR